MAATKRKQRPQDIADTNRRISRRPERSPREAAAAKISPAVPPAGAAILADADPALDTESETKQSLERATRGGRDRLTGEE